jgi:hypothetical protein
MGRVGIILGLAMLVAESATSAGVSEQIIVDQFGWRATASNKVAIFAHPITGQNSGVHYIPGSTFQVRRTSDGVAVFTGSVVPWNGGATNAQSGDQVWWGDFSPFKTPGEYHIYDPGNDLQSFSFEIRDDLYNAIQQTSIRTFYYQRCGTAISPEFGGNSLVSHSCDTFFNRIWWSTLTYTSPATAQERNEGARGGRRRRAGGQEGIVDKERAGVARSSPWDGRS